MLRPIPVILEPYNPRWPEIAANHIARLSTLGTNVLAIYHIGSTSIPELAAKPIIDLMPVVDELNELDRQRHIIEGLGYVWHSEGGLSGRRYCTFSDEAGVRLVQVHCFEADSLAVKRHLAFRDYLRAHPATAKAYEMEKRRAQKLHRMDSHAYGDEKSAWIERAEENALEWYTTKLA